MEIFPTRDPTQLTKNLKKISNQPMDYSGTLSLWDRPDPSQRTQRGLSAGCWDPYSIVTNDILYVNGAVRVNNTSLSL